MRPSYRKQTQSLTTRDGVRLDADLYLPPGDGPFPVLLMRQPYGRAIASTVVYAHPSWYAAQGYLVVIQDVRGRGTSAGRFDLFADEVEDGYDTVEWAAQLPQSNGRVGLYGFSYQGMTQLYAAQAQPPALQALAPAMVGYHPYADWAYENGALLLQAGAGWALQLAAETARLAGDRVAYQALYRAARQGSYTDAVPAAPDVLSRYAPESFWHDWLAHPHLDAYWQGLIPDLRAVDLPMLHVGGWFDPYLRGDLRLYKEMVQRSQYPQLLWVGPWGHLPWGRRLGDRDFGPEAHSPIDRLQIRWFDHWLKGKDTGLMAEPPVRLFEMGRNRWRSFDHWPEGNPRFWHPRSRGMPTMRPQEGQLVEILSGETLAEESVTLGAQGKGWSQTPSQTPSPSQVPPEIDVLVHDPWRPVPSLGGHAAIPAGPYGRSQLDDRSDVLTYTSAPFLQRCTLAGMVTVTVTCQADAPSFDLSAVLSEVQPDGTVYAFTQGYGRFDLPPDEFHRCEVPLQPTCIAIAMGHTLRLSLSASCFPAYALNPGTGAPAATSTVFDARIITLSVALGPESETHLALPLLLDR